MLLLLLAATSAATAAGPVACAVDDAALVEPLAVLPGMPNATTCAEVQPWCAHPLLGFVVRNACPVTCSVACTLYPLPLDNLACNNCTYAFVVFALFHVHVLKHTHQARKPMPWL